MATKIIKNNITPIEYFTILELNEIVKYLKLYIKDCNYESDYTWNMFYGEKHEFYDYVKEKYDGQIIKLLLYEEIIEFILKVKIEGDNTSKKLSQTLETSDEDTLFETTLRNYYLLVMNNIELNFIQKLQIIYMDLVIPQLTHFNSKQGDDGFEVKYSYRNPFIHEKMTKMFTCGRVPDSTLQTDISNASVSRCNFIMLKINDEYIILSGWSCSGTRCISRENTEADEYIGNKSLMRFNENETFIIGIGNEEFQEIITFNPKTCVVCLENKCEIRGSCNHATLCISCHEKFKINSSIVKCPICREIYKNDKVSQCIRTFV